MDHIFIRGHAVELKDSIHICIGKAEVLIIPEIRNRVYLQVIQPSEDALLRDPETSGKYREVQVVICLQHIAKQVADKIYRLIIAASLERFI